MSETIKNHVLTMFYPEDQMPRWFGGPTAVNSVTDVDANCAVWKPAPDRHSIWELVLHIAFWKYEVRKTISENAPEPFPRKPDNWPEMPSQLNEENWNKDKVILVSEHRDLVESIRQFDESRMGENLKLYPDLTYADVISGILHHDLYHTGQIVLMKRLYASIVQSPE